MQFIKVGGKERSLRYSYNSVCAIEDAFGMGMESIFSKEQVGFRTTRILLWGALKTSQRNITLDQAGDLIEEYMREGNDIDSLASKCILAYKEFLPNADEDIEDEQTIEKK